MAEYDPPIYDVSVFNPAYFLDEDEITKSYLRANFLEFPVGQGLETLPDLRVENTSIHLGEEAGLNSQSSPAVAIGLRSGKFTQSTGAIAIGENAGINSQGSQAIAIGSNPAQTSQGTKSIAIGSFCGDYTQGDYAVAIGNQAGQNNQSVRAISIGDFAGSVSQGNSSVAVGNFAGNDNQQGGAVAIGIQAGQNNQGANSVAIGSYAGYSGGNLGDDSVAIGNAARATGVEAVSIGHNATSTGDEAVCIGHYANTQGDNSIAIGNAANTGTADKAIAIGFTCRALGNESIAIGDLATTSSYTNSVAIGNGATANNNDEVKLSDKASFIGDATQGWSFGDLGAGLAGWAGLQHIGYGRTGTNYALLQNASTGTTSVGGVSQLNLNVGNSLKAFITDTLRINTAGIGYNGTTQPTGGANNLIGFRWKGSTAQVGVGVDNVLGGYFASLSDRRAKKNIVDYTDGLTGIMKLKPKQYEFLKIDVAKCDLTADNCIIRDLSGNTIEYDSEGNCCDDTETYGELNTGLILDEVKPIFPQVCEGGDENSIGTINYAGLVPMLIKAVQQQQEQIEALKLEVEALKNP